MYILISVIILLVCGLLILVVLIQNSKGGGLASNFSGSNQIMGVRRTADFLEKATWTLAIILLALSVITSWTIPSRDIKKESMIKEQVENQDLPGIDPNAIPSLPGDFSESEDEE